MGYQYPAAPATLSGDVLSINRFLKDPTLVARRLRTVAEQRYIADALLTGRFSADGGSIVYETGETIFADQNPRAVAPGAEYPITGVSEGTASIARTVNWGEDAIVTDASIARRKMDPVSRAFDKLVNQNVKYVDSVALSAIASAVTATSAAGTGWATATAASILKDVGLAQANITALNQGYDPDTVVVDDVSWTYAMIAFIAAGYVPRESLSDNPTLTGQFPVILGMRWLKSPNVPTAGTGLVLDSRQLGGMADENLGGPGYVSAAGPNTAPVQVKTIRDEERDRWKLRARRVTVPVILEPAAARKITGL